jgi:hypothetical protein
MNKPHPDNVPLRARAPHQPTTTPDEHELDKG